VILGRSIVERLQHLFATLAEGTKRVAQSDVANPYLIDIGQLGPGMHAAQLVGLDVVGGERGIRTLEGLLTLTPLAGARLRPLGHLSVLARKPNKIKGIMHKQAP
jgi:hypothetical protein